MKASSPQKPKRKSVLLALGYNVYEINFGVAEYAKKAGWILNDAMCHFGRLPSQWRGDGVITLLNPDAQPSLIDMVKETRVPVVNLAHYRDRFISGWVLPDNQKIGSIAANHFLTRGFEHFAFFRLTSEPVVMERLCAFRDAALKAGKTFYDINFETAPKRSQTQENLLLWLSQQLRCLPKPLAAMAQYDVDANEVVRAAHNANLLVPDDVAVVGVDNDPVYSQLGPVPLTSVLSNRRLAGYRAAELLDQIMDRKPNVARNIRIEPEGIVVRKSSDIIAAEDTHVAKALRYIWEHFREPITVDDVVLHSGTSRRGLYDRFERIVGHPIHLELMRQRIETAKQLLRDTDGKLQAIADSCGLIDAERFSKSFKRFCGISPSEYRTTHRTSFANPDEKSESDAGDESP